MSAVNETRCGLRGVPRRLSLGERPVRGHLLTRTSRRQRRIDLRDHQRWLIDLNGGVDIRCRQFQRRLRFGQVCAGLIAAELDPEREAAQRLRAAGIDPAATGFALDPAGNGLAGAIGGIEPERAPAGRDNHKHERGNKPAD